MVFGTLGSQIGSFFPQIILGVKTENNILKAHHLVRDFFAISRSRDFCWEIRQLGTFFGMVVVVIFSNKEIDFLVNLTKKKTGPNDDDQKLNYHGFTFRG